MATLVLGSGIGRAIGIAAIPILTRLYTPQDFGVLAVFTALVAILAPLVTLRYVLAFPLPRHDGVAMNLLAVSIGLMLSLSALVAIALWHWGEAFLPVVSMDLLAPWWWLISLGVLGTATYEMLTMWATRKRTYKVIAQTNVTQSAVSTLVKIGLGLISLQPLGLLLGQVVAQAGGIARLLRGFSADFHANWRHVTSSRMRMAAWQYRGFPIWRVPAQFLLVGAQHAPVLFFAAQYPPSIVGQLSIAMFVVSLSVNIIGQSVSQSIYGEIAKETDDGKILKILMHSSTGILLICVPLALIIAAWGSDIFRIFMGENWEIAGIYAQIFSIYVPVAVLAVALSPVLNKYDDQRTYLIINLTRFVIIYLILVVGQYLSLTPVWNFSAYVVAISLFQFSVSAYFLILVRKKAKRGKAR